MHGKWIYWFHCALLLLRRRLTNQPTTGRIWALGLRLGLDLGRFTTPSTSPSSSSQNRWIISVCFPSFFPCMLFPGPFRPPVHHRPQRNRESARGWMLLFAEIMSHIVIKWMNFNNKSDWIIRIYAENIQITNWLLVGSLPRRPVKRMCCMPMGFLARTHPPPLTAMPTRNTTGEGYGDWWQRCSI